MCGDLPTWLEGEVEEHHQACSMHPKPANPEHYTILQNGNITPWTLTSFTVVRINLQQDSVAIRVRESGASGDRARNRY